MDGEYGVNRAEYILNRRGAETQRKETVAEEAEKDGGRAAGYFVNRRGAETQRKETGAEEAEKDCGRAAGYFVNRRGAETQRKETMAEGAEKDERRDAGYVVNRRGAETQRKETAAEEAEKDGGRAAGYVVNGGGTETQRKETSAEGAGKDGGTAVRDSDVPLEDQITRAIIGCAIEVHRHLGPGLLESAYEECLCFELAQRGLRFRRQVHLPVAYKGVKLDCGYKMDILVEERVVVEVKTVDHLLPVHTAQLLTYLKLADKRVGLLINFHATTLKRGLKRLVNQFSASSAPEKEPLRLGASAVK